MESILKKYIYISGVKIRNPELIHKYNFLKESEKWSIEELEDYQLSQLKQLLIKTYENSSFYKTLYDEANISINDIRTLNDLKKLPVVTKADILDNIDDIQDNENYKKMFLSETSGSTGEPLVFYRNKEWDAGHRAAQLRGYSWFGVNNWEKNGYFWGYNFSTVEKMKGKILDTLLNRFRVFSYSEDAIKSFSKKLESANYVEGYSSMIYEVAKVINKYNLGPFNLKMVKGTSEKIYDSYQDEAIKAFGKKIISEYGAAETGIIAFECPSGNMHIAMENVIVEEEDGEAIITNLISDSFPIIRYKLGDSIVIDNNIVCSCGMKHKVISDVVGRVGKVIYGYSGKYPSLTLYYIFKNLSLNYNVQVNYQAIQKEKGRLELYLDKKLSKNELTIIQKECKAYFKEDILIEVFENKLERDYSKKFKDFISYL